MGLERLPGEVIADLEQRLVGARALRVFRRAGDESGIASGSARDRDPNQRRKCELRRSLWDGPATQEKLVEATLREIRKDLCGRRRSRDRLRPCTTR